MYCYQDSRIDLDHSLGCQVSMMIFPEFHSYWVSLLTESSLMDLSYYSIFSVKYWDEVFKVIVYP